MESAAQGGGSTHISGVSSNSTAAGCCAQLAGAAVKCERGRRRRPAQALRKRPRGWNQGRAHKEQTGREEMGVSQQARARRAGDAQRGQTAEGQGGHTGTASSPTHSRLHVLTSEVEGVRGSGDDGFGLDSSGRAGRGRCGALQQSWSQGDCGVGGGGGSTAVVRSKSPGHTQDAEEQWRRVGVSTSLCPHAAVRALPSLGPEAGLPPPPHCPPTRGGPAGQAGDLWGPMGHFASGFPCAPPPLPPLGVRCGSA
jgi:hypothetical protein